MDDEAGHRAGPFALVRGDLAAGDRPVQQPGLDIGHGCGPDTPELVAVPVRREVFISCLSDVDHLTGRGQTTGFGPVSFDQLGERPRSVDELFCENQDRLSFNERSNGWS